MARKGVMMHDKTKPGNVKVGPAPFSNSFSNHKQTHGRSAASSSSGGGGSAGMKKGVKEC